MSEYNPDKWVIVKFKRGRRVKCIYENTPTFTGEPSCEGEVKLHGAMTAYHFEGEKNSPEDPNKDFYCCEAHYEEYYQYWKERWDEYYSGLL